MSSAGELCSLPSPTPNATESIQFNPTFTATDVHHEISVVGQALCDSRAQDHQEIEELCVDIRLKNEIETNNQGIKTEATTAVNVSVKKELEEMKNIHDSEIKTEAETNCVDVKREQLNIKDEESIKEEEIKTEIKTEPESSDDNEDDSDDESSESFDEEIQRDPRARLRRRKVNPAKLAAVKKKSIYSKISKIVRKCSKEGVNKTKEEEQLVKAHPKVFKEVLKNLSRRKLEEDRKKEIEDSPTKLNKKCIQLAKAIQKAKYLVVYTGAGISTAANIPDYRGPNGVWTLLEKGQEVADCNLETAEPTYTHMALFNLFKKGKLKHIVSQNCDGLHLRSGIPRYALSEVHGNMFIEICKRCKPMRPFIRLFDVTEKTSRNRHNTGRRCHVCGHSLVDTIVHFGERGHLKWPINWDGASKAAEKADMILCLGSSLKVLRRYPWLWCMDRPKKDRPSLYIVNLQWTPKDSAATLKLNGKCDEVMKKVMSILDYEVPQYYSSNDPLLTYSTPLHPEEEHTTTRTVLVGQNEFRVRSWSLDHAYANKSGKTNESPPKLSKYGRKQGCFVPRQNVDFQNAVWPRDALYCSYKELKFEYVLEAESQGETGYYCDCCDPAKRPKRSSSEEEDDDDDEDEDEDNEDENEGSNLDEDNDSKSSEKTEDSTTRDRASSRSSSLGPGWFGKGRRIKRLRT